MPTLTVKGPDDRVEQSIELGDADAILIGRAPDAGGVTRAPEEAYRPVRTLALAAPSVSANHALAWSEDGAIFVRDLGSRNGSHVSLPRNGTVRVSGVRATLRLAQAPEQSADPVEPPTAKWSGAEDFARALGASVEEWLARRQIQARVVVVGRPVVGADLPGRVPLATGEAIDVVPLQTVDAAWAQELELLWRWVAKQNAIFVSEQESRHEGMILASAAIRAAHREALAAARAGARTLLLMGPSGAGKERLAEAFHRATGREGPFVAVNCSMFNREMLRSELFGAEAGSFTGAVRRIVGAVERAHGGTLFLDEIGELEADVQPMLLRFLDRYEYERLGQSGRAQRADVRVVAATNRDLREAARAGKFRADLWYRLSVQVIDVPPLRARADDVTAYLESVMLDGGWSLAAALSEPARELLRAHPWEGNFRELTNFAARLPRDAAPGTLDAATCKAALERGALRPVETASAAGGDGERPGDWPELAARAVSAFREDRGYEPRTWDDQKECNEKYLKPLLFFRLSATSGAPPADEEALGALASRAAAHVHADRGTALKQLARYFERFGERFGR